MQPQPIHCPALDPAVTDKTLINRRAELAARKTAVDGLYAEAERLLAADQTESLAAILRRAVAPSRLATIQAREMELSLRLDLDAFAHEADQAHAELENAMPSLDSIRDAVASKLRAAGLPIVKHPYGHYGVHTDAVDSHPDVIANHARRGELRDRHNGNSGFLGRNGEAADALRERLADLRRKLLAAG